MVSWYMPMTPLSFLLDSKSYFFNLSASSLYSLSFLLSLLKVGFISSWGVVISKISMGCSRNLDLPFIWVEISVASFFTGTFFLVVALVKGFLGLTMSAAIGEGNTRFIPLGPKDFLERTSIEWAMPWVKLPYVKVVKALLLLLHLWHYHLYQSQQLFSSF